MVNLIFYFAIVINWFSQSIIESYKFMPEDVKNSNPLVCKKNNPGRGTFSYHGWRMIFHLMFILIIILGVNFNTSGCVAFSGFVLGWFIYEHMTYWLIRYDQKLNFFKVFFTDKSVTKIKIKDYVIYLPINKWIFQVFMVVISFGVLIFK